MKTTSHIHINYPKHRETKKVIIIVSLDCIRHTSSCITISQCTLMLALAEHALVAGHGIDLSKTEVVDSNPYTATRCMLESWHIQHNENKLNKERGNLPELYAALLDWNFTLRHYTLSLHWHPSHPSHLYYHVHCHVTYLQFFTPFHLNFNIILAFFIVVVTSCHSILFKQYRVFPLSFTDEGSSLLPKRLNKC